MLSGSLTLLELSDNPTTFRLARSFDNGSGMPTFVAFAADAAMDDLHCCGQGAFSKQGRAMCPGLAASRVFCDSACDSASQEHPCHQTWLAPNMIAETVR